jgi:hypothetical protein
VVVKVNSSGRNRPPPGLVARPRRRLQGQRLRAARSRTGIAIHPSVGLAEQRVIETAHPDWDARYHGIGRGLDHAAKQPVGVVAHDIGEADARHVATGSAIAVSSIHPRKLLLTCSIPGTFSVCRSSGRKSPLCRDLRARPRAHRVVNTCGHACSGFQQNPFAKALGDRRTMLLFQCLA